VNVVTAALVEAEEVVVDLMVGVDAERDEQ
jgi:hypothetical protein